MTCRHAPTCWGGIFDYVNRKDRLSEVELELGEPDVWNEPERAQELGRERSSLETVVKTIEDLKSDLKIDKEIYRYFMDEYKLYLEQDRTGIIWLSQDIIGI